MWLCCVQVGIDKEAGGALLMDAGALGNANSYVIIAELQHCRSMRQGSVRQRRGGQAAACTVSESIQVA